MFSCPTSHPALPALFDPQVPNHAALWAVLMGRHTGTALVDDPNHPSQCLLHTDAALTYASRSISQDFLAGAIEQYRHSEPIWLIRNPGDPPAPGGYQILPRLEFYENDPQGKVLGELRKHLPIGFELRLIDKDLLQRCTWRDDMVFYCGSLENFLCHNLGLCLMKGEEIIVEAYASAIGVVDAEIGAITHEQYRGRGYAPVTVAFLIEKLEQRGYRAYWSCDVDNPASAQVARKLGFRVEREYETFEYQPEGSPKISPAITIGADYSA